MTKQTEMPRAMRTTRRRLGEDIWSSLIQPANDVYTPQNVGLRVHFARLCHRIWWTYYNRIEPAWRYQHWNRKPDLTLPPDKVRPMDNLLWTLAVFSRTLRFIQTAADNQDRDGLVLSSCLANLLHNEPGYMLGFDPDAHWKTIPPHHQDRGTIVTDLHLYFLDRDIPESLLPACDAIFSLDGTEAELGLKPDGSDIDPAPPVKFILYGHMLYQACLLIRMEHVPEGEEDFSERVKCRLRLVSKVARLLQPIPSALVRWKEFDERAFRRGSRPDWSDHPGNMHWACMIFCPARWHF